MAAQTTTLEFLLTAKDHASEVFEKVGKKTDGTSSKLSKLKVAGGVGLAALGAAAVKFGKDSVEAAEDAEVKQQKLADAYSRFPKLADANIDKLRELNSQIERKTGFDDDDLAAAQAQLAQFGLTGKQLQQLTPLVADYATKTGKDLPTAAKSLGLALTGNQRALKQIGISLPPLGAAQKAVAAAQKQSASAAENLKAKQQALADVQASLSTKSKLTAADHQRLEKATRAVSQAQAKAREASKNLGAAQRAAASDGSQFDKVVGGLTDKVGGFAEKAGTTAAGKAKILSAEFGELQEKAGGALAPALEKVTDVGIKLVDWLQKTPGALTAVSVAVGIGAVAWAAMTLAASPWLAIGAGIALVVGGIIVLFKNWSNISTRMKTILFATFPVITGVIALIKNWGTVVGWLKGVWGSVAGFFKRQWDLVRVGVAGIVGFFGSLPGKIGALVGRAKDAIAKAFSYTPLGVIVTHFGAIIDFIKGIPGKIVSGLGDLKNLLLSAGGDVVQGLVNGITGAVGKVVDAAKRIVDNISGPVKKLLGIASPSKLFREYGRNTVQGYIKGLDDLSGAAKKRAEKLANDVSAAASKLNDLKSARSQMRSSIAGNITGALDLASGLGQTDANGYTSPTTFGSVAGTVSALAAKAKAFAGKLSSLIKKGIPAGLVQQVAGLGIDQGIAVADALLSGTASQVRGLASDWSALQRYSNAAGASVAGQAYNAQVASAQAKYDRLKAEQARAKRDERLVDNLAKKLAKELRAHPGNVTLVVDRRQAGLLKQAGETYERKHK